MIVNAITSFGGVFAPLSNFHPCVVVLDGVRYPSVEHAYQAAKTLVARERSLVRLMSTPGKAKAAGRMVTLRRDWDEVRVGVMRDLVRQKFVGSEKMALMLLATGSAELIEGNYWGDTFWGVCDGRGQNWLGQILMEVRRELRDARDLAVKKRLTVKHCVEDWDEGEVPV